MRRTDSRSRLFSPTEDPLGDELVFHSGSWPWVKTLASSGRPTRGPPPVPTVAYTGEGAGEEWWGVSWKGVGSPPPVVGRGGGVPFGTQTTDPHIPGQKRVTRDPDRGQPEGRWEVKDQVVYSAENRPDRGGRERVRPTPP